MKSFSRSFQGYQSNLSADSGVSQNCGIPLYLVQTHLDLAFQNNIQKQKLIYTAGWKLCSIDWGSINADDVINEGLVADLLDNSLKDHPCMLNFHHILCSSSGLVCIADIHIKTVLVINPCTGESRRVLIESQEHRLVGFGYSSTSDTITSWCQWIMQFLACMYSLRSDTWRSKFTAPLHYDFPYGVFGVPLNGALHCIGRITVDGHAEFVLVSFDLDEKTMREMPLPPTLSDFEDIFFASLGVVNGCLCAHHRGRISDSFWVMRDYNNGKSWTKVSTSRVPLDTSGLGAKKNARIKDVEKKIVMCTFENGTHGIPTGLNFNKIGTYVESLISPNHFVGE